MNKKALSTSHVIYELIKDLEIKETKLIYSIERSSGKHKLDLQLKLNIVRNRIQHGRTLLEKDEQIL